jgi:hypothetical protein
MDLPDSGGTEIVYDPVRVLPGGIQWILGGVPGVGYDDTTWDLM